MLTKLLKKLVFASLYKKATTDDIEALNDNTKKHVRALLKSLVVIPGTILAVRYGGQVARDIIFYVSIAAQIVGIAWFVITFAALPKRHIGAAMDCTEYMFSAFLGGVISLAVFAGMTAPLSLSVIVPIYVWMYKGAAIYDFADLLKAGKDEQELLAAYAIQRIEKLLAQAVAAKMG